MLVTRYVAISKGTISSHVTMNDRRQSEVTTETKGGGRRDILCVQVFHHLTGARIHMANVFVDADKTRHTQICSEVVLTVEERIWLDESVMDAIRTVDENYFFDHLVFFGRLAEKGIL